MKKDAKVIREYQDEKSGANMVVYWAQATSLDKASGKRVVVKEGEYHEPKTLEDGLLFDGEESVEKTWKSERFTNTLDDWRRSTGETKNALQKQLITAMFEGDKAKCLEIADKLGLDLKQGLKKIVAQLLEETKEDDKSTKKSNRPPSHRIGE